MGYRDLGSSLNDPDLWSLNGCKVPDVEVGVDEPCPFHVPFDECLARAEGNRNLAKFFFYKQFTQRHKLATVP